MASRGFAWLRTVLRAFVQFRVASHGFACFCAVSRSFVQFLVLSYLIAHFCAFVCFRVRGRERVDERGQAGAGGRGQVLACACAGGQGYFYTNGDCLKYFKLLSSH